MEKSSEGIGREKRGYHEEDSILQSSYLLELELSYPVNGAADGLLH